ncbi:MAG: hypothetical protein WA209_14565 [Candidatus Acidiferrales bacterium]
MKLRAFLRRTLKFFLLCFALLLIVIAVSLAAGWRCALKSQIQPGSAVSPEENPYAAKIKDYVRPEDDAYLGYPEWYIVWSYQEKADYQQSHLPSGFPYFGAVRQYWSSYCCISRLIHGKYPFNGGEQVMLVVIGTSFSAEYILKGAYETTIGRFTEWLSGGEAVAEDAYAYKVARDYADFVHIRPFYEFRFARRVPELWRETPLWGPHPIRKWERKLFLSLDYLLEAFYCWVIQGGTHLTYGYEPEETYAAIDHADETFVRSIPHVKVIQKLGPDALVVDIPRYQEFTVVAEAMAQQGVRFTDIAGNTRITISVLAPTSWRYPDADAQELFSQPMLTQPGIKRVVLGCEVSVLNVVTQNIRAQGVHLEHVYDY